MTAIFDPAQLTTPGDSYLPDVYAYLLEYGTLRPTAAADDLDVSRSAIYTSIDSLDDAGILENPERGVYTPGQPSPPWHVVDGLATMNAPSDYTVTAAAVDQRRTTEEALTDAVDVARATVSRVTDRLVDDGYLTKDAAESIGGQRMFELTTYGEQQLHRLDDTAVMSEIDDLPQRGHVPDGIGPTEFHHPYEIRDLAAISGTGVGTADEIGTRFDDDPAAVRRRLARLEDRGFLDAWRLQNTNTYRPTTAADTLVDQSRRTRLAGVVTNGGLDALPDDIDVERLIDDQLPATFQPRHLYEIDDAIDGQNTTDFINDCHTHNVLAGDRYTGYSLP